MYQTVSLFGNGKIPGVATFCLAIRPGQEIVWLTVLILLKITRKCSLKKKKKDKKNNLYTDVHSLCMCRNSDGGSCSWLGRAAM